MTKYYLEPAGYGKASYYKIKSCSNSHAKKIKGEGKMVFDTREEALSYIRSKR